MYFNCAPDNILILFFMAPTSVMASVGVQVVELLKTLRVDIASLEVLVLNTITVLLRMHLQMVKLKHVRYLVLRQALYYVIVEKQSILLFSNMLPGMILII